MTQIDAHWVEGIRLAIAAGRWTDAERDLARWPHPGGQGDPSVLSWWRELNDARGTRPKTLAVVADFLQAFPGLATDPRVRLERGLALRQAGEREAARRELLAALDQFDAQSAPREVALAENGLGASYLSPLDAPRAKRHFMRSREIAEPAKLWDRVAASDINLGLLEIQTGEMAAAAGLFRRGLAMAERAGDRALMCLAAYNLGNCLHDLGRNASARRFLVRARDLGRERGQLWFVAWTALELGELERKAGRRESAERHYAEAHRTFTALGGPTETESAWVALRRAELAVDGGDTTAARKLAKAALSPKVAMAPRLLMRLLLLQLAAEESPSAKTAKNLEALAREAESAGLVDVAWRARAGVARTLSRELQSRWLDGEVPAAQPKIAEEAARAQGLLEGVIRNAPRSARRAYLRDHVRRRDTEWLALVRAIASASGPVRAESPRPDAGGRRDWLRLLFHVGSLAEAADPPQILARAADAFLELTGAELMELVLDADQDRGPADVVIRDADGQSRLEPPNTRRIPLHHGDRRIGHVRLAPTPIGKSDVEEMIASLGSVLWPLLRGARAREALREGTRLRDLEAQRLEVELARAEAARGATDDAARPGERGGIIGRSPAIHEMFRRLDRIAQSSLSVLITGESGTGKELVARVIHDESPRKSRPFVAVNCAAMPEALLETELFGHLRGAFTGAERDALGLFAVADGGTLLLDEVGDMSLAMQAKLLRVLQDGEVRPVGGRTSRKVDVRILAATHRPLRELASRGSFREDLFFRLDVLSVHVPPLRARGDDIVLLARHFLQAIAPTKAFGPDAATWLLAQAFSGNVRELKALVEAVAVLTEARIIHRSDLAAKNERRPARSVPRDVPERLEDLEAWAIQQALHREQGSLARAARSLGIARATLYRKVALYGLTVERAK